MKRIFLALMLTATTAHAEIPGYDRMDVRTDHRAYPVAASVWYPKGSVTYKSRIGDNPIFHGTPVFVGPQVAAGRHPLVLFSHGSGGSMDGSAWLLSALANRGAMVLAVNHPGSTSGDSSPRRSVRLDERAADLSAALDALLAEPAFAAHVDMDKIITVGFSLGGATALNLAGMRLDAGRYGAYCADAGRMDCAFFAKGGVDFAALPDGFSADMRDPRVTATVAIDPAFTYVATDESLSQMALPVGLINLGKANRLSAADVSDAGSGFVARLPNAAYAELSPANHFTFLPECKDRAEAMLAEEGEDPICSDPVGSDRRAIHQAIADQIAAFVGL